MCKKWMGLMGAVCVILGMILPVQAAETGSVQIVPIWGGKQIVGGEVILSRAGDRVQNGFRITDGLADWTVSGEELFSGAWTNWLAWQDQKGEHRRTVQESGAFFDGLPEGLYLVQQAESAPEFMAFRPFLVSVPVGEQWDVIRQVPLTHIAEAPRTGDRHVPLLGAMGIGFSVALLMVMADQRKK